MFNSIQDTIHLAKNTFVILGKNKEALKPTFAQIKIGLGLYLLFLIGIIAVFFTDIAAKFFIIIELVMIFFIMIIVFPFIKIYYRAAQSWIVFNTFAGKNISYKEGLDRAGRNKGDIITLGILDFIFTALSSSLKRGTGRGGLFALLNIILFILGKAIEEGWDLVGNYLLPASIVQNKSVMEALPELKNIKNNVPGALVGVFGVDFVGDALRSFILFMILIFVAIGIAIGFYLGTWIPLILIILLVLPINLIMNVLIEMVKTVYFTLFFTAIVMPMKISPEYRKEVTQYLQNQENSGNSKQTPEEKLNMLVTYVEQYRRQGYSDNEIKTFLASSGWPADIVNKALIKTKKGG